MRIALFKGESRYSLVNGFVDALAEALSAAGAKTMTVDLSLPSGELGEQLSAICDAEDLIALVGVNGLGAMVKVDGGPLHESLGVPFISYVVDHPLFHADRLTRVQDQPVLCVDAAHMRFLETFGALQAHFAPHAGATPADYYSAPRWAERPGRVLYAGTFEPLDVLRRRLADVVAGDQAAEDAGIPVLNDAFEALADEALFTDDQALIDAAAAHPLTFAVQQFLGISAHYTTLLRCLILWNRARLRTAILAQLDHDGLAVDLVGDGWDGAGFKHHRALGALPFADLHRLLPSYRFVLNAGSLFGEGLNERVAYGAMAGAVVCTDHNPKSADLIGPGGALGYAPGDASGLADAINRLDLTAEGAAMAALGREITMFNHTWGVRARQILKILGR